MTQLSLRFGRLPDGRILDFAPMELGAPPLVFDSRTPDLGWVAFEGTFGDARVATPLTIEEEKALTGDADIDMPTIEDAITLATEAHRDDTDKGDAPYIFHPLRLMEGMQSEVDKIVAVLHDVVEDNPSITIQDLKMKGYSQEILDAVDCLTRRKDEETYDEFIERCRGNPIARRVKIADLEDNMDIRRLNELTEKDLDRLNKYLRAWKYLTEECKGEEDEEE